jgi:uncharacterized protein (DUF433 family)
MKSTSLLSRITRIPDIYHGKPTVRGLRYSVDMLLELMASGMSNQEILEDYPDLEMDDLLACLEYAARLSQTKSFQKIAL